MAEKVVLSLHTIPVDLAYQILDHLDEVTLVVAVRNVCLRLNAITDTYQRFRVSCCDLTICCTRILRRHLQN